MLTPFADEIWIADGPVVSGALGFDYPTRMAVIRLEGGDLAVWSPVGLSETLRRDVDALGPVRHIIAPNTLHHLFLSEWTAAFPDAAVYGAPGLAKKRADLSFTAELSETPEAAWSGEIDQVLVRTLITTEVIFFHRRSATVIITDLVQCLPGDWFKGWKGLIARLDKMTGPEPAVPRKFRLAMTDKTSGRRAVAALLDWPAQRLIIAHGAPVSSGAHAVLERAFEWLTG